MLAKHLVILFAVIVVAAEWLGWLPPLTEAYR